MQTIKKHTKPTKFDLSLPRTIWEEISEDPQMPNKLYIQISDEVTESHWITLGEFYERAFDRFTLNDEFLVDVFRIYKGRNGGENATDMIHAVASKRKDTVCRGE